MLSFVLEQVAAAAALLHAHHTHTHGLYDIVVSPAMSPMGACSLFRSAMLAHSVSHNCFKMHPVGSSVLRGACAAGTPASANQPYTTRHYTSTTLHHTPPPTTTHSAPSTHPVLLHSIHVNGPPLFADTFPHVRSCCCTQHGLEVSLYCGAFLHCSLCSCSCVSLCLFLYQCSRSAWFLSL